MAVAPATRRKQEPRQQGKTKSRKASKAGAGEPSGAVIILSGATPLRRQKAANVLAEELQLHLAAVDWSAVVSQHARETEKNVNRVFDMANRHGSILFFDEADALFGKRTGQGEGHERPGNDGVAHLLHCIEQHQGLVILATNGKRRIEDLFPSEKPVIVLGGAAKNKRSQTKATPAVRSRKTGAK